MRRLLLGLVLVACATPTSAPPTAQQIQAADCGVELGAADAETAIRSWHEGKSPTTVGWYPFTETTEAFRIDPPQRGWCKSESFETTQSGPYDLVKHDPTYGYLVKARSPTEPELEFFFRDGRMQFWRYVGSTFWEVPPTPLDPSPRPTRDQILAADFGPPPNDPEQIVRAYIARSFKDPDSVKDLSVLPPRKKWWRDSSLGTGAKWACGPPRYGWSVMFTCNAKNSYGGYTGLKTTELTVLNGAVIDAH